MIVMTLKQFLKPDWRKIVLFVIVLFLLTFFLGIKFSAIPEIESIIEIGYPPFLTIIEGFLGNKTYKWNFTNLIFNIVIWYLLSCVIIWIYDKIKKK